MKEILCKILPASVWSFLRRAKKRLLTEPKKYLETQIRLKLSLPLRKNKTRLYLRFTLPSTVT